jgi:methylated-DNA-[protein]-cysteine S-methyltransferase
VKNKNSASFRGFTDFQLRVLEETLRIPFGRVRAYSWIAKRVGSPGAARAVGSVLRKNPYPLFIPCHRVVKSDGTLGRYSGGKGVKRKLIEFEKRLKNIFCLKRKKDVL